MFPCTPASSSTPKVNSGAIAGTATNDSATFGNIGQFYQTLVAVGSPVALSNNTAANVCNVALPNGDWDVEANCNFTATGCTITASSASISQTSATHPTDGSEVPQGLVYTTTAFLSGVTLPRKRASLTSTVHTGLTAVAATDVITDVANGYANGQPVYFTALTGGAGLAVNTIYYVINVATDSYKLSATSGGAAIDITTTMTAGTLYAATLVYMVAKATFSAGSISGYGQINARRVR